MLGVSPGLCVRVCACVDAAFSSQVFSVYRHGDRSTLRQPKSSGAPSEGSIRHHDFVFARAGSEEARESCSSSGVCL